MGRVSCKPHGMHTIYITNVVHKILNENGRTQTLLPRLSTHGILQVTESWAGLRNEVRTAVGLVLCS